MYFEIRDKSEKSFGRSAPKEISCYLLLLEDERTSALVNGQKEEVS